MHLHSVHRSSYYAAPAAHSTLARRDSSTNGSNTLWQTIVAPVALVALAVGAFLLFFFVRRALIKHWDMQTYRFERRPKGIGEGKYLDKYLRQTDSKVHAQHQAEAPPAYGQQYEHGLVNSPAPAHTRPRSRPSYCETLPSHRSPTVRGFPAGWGKADGKFFPAFRSEGNDGFDSTPIAPPSA